MFHSFPTKKIGFHYPAARSLDKLSGEYSLYIHVYRELMLLLASRAIDSISRFDMSTHLRRAVKADNGMFPAIKAN